MLDYFIPMEELLRQLSEHQFLHLEMDIIVGEDMSVSSFAGLTTHTLLAKNKMQ